MHTTSLSTAYFEGILVAKPTNIFKRNNYLKMFTVFDYFIVLSRKITGTPKQANVKICVCSAMKEQFCALDVGYLVRRMTLELCSFE